MRTKLHKLFAWLARKCDPDKPLPISEHQMAVRKAIRNLARHGLRISELTCHPWTMYAILNTEMVVGQVLEVKGGDVIVPKDFKQTYMGIPIVQSGTEPTPHL